MREQPRDRGFAGAGRTPEDERAERAGADEPRQRALGSKQMILSRHLIETRRPQSVGERTRRVVFELRGLEQIGHGY